jgi:hypothetical protein
MGSLQKLCEFQRTAAEAAEAAVAEMLAKVQRGISKRISEIIWMIG